MSSYNHSLPRIWGADFLYQHHMTWGSASCLLTGHLSDLIAFMCWGSAPSLHLAGPAEPALPQGPPPCTLPSSQARTPLSATQMPGHGDLLLCHTQNLFLSVPLGAAPYFPFSKWPCESQRVCTSGTYSNSLENPRLVTKSKRQRRLKHSKDKTLKDASPSSAISGLLSFPYLALQFFLGFWLIHFSPNLVLFFFGGGAKLASFSVVADPTLSQASYLDSNSVQPLWSTASVVLTAGPQGPSPDLGS